MANDHALITVPGARVAGHTVSLNDLLYTLKVGGRLDAFRAAVDDLLIHVAVREAGLAADVAELQAEANARRQNMGLLRAADTQRWLRQQHMSTDDFEQFLWRRVTTRKLRQQICAPQIDDYFIRNRADLDAACIASIVLENEEVARDILEALAQPGANFAALARRFTIDARAHAVGGHVGYVRRMAMDPAVAKAVFLANAGATIGPIRSSAGFEVIRVEDIQRAALNPAMRAFVSDVIFNDWLHERRRAAEADLSFADQLAPPNGCSAQ